MFRGAGNDQLSGESGAGVFLYTAIVGGSGRDTIADFSRTGFNSVDKVHCEAVMGGPSLPGGVAVFGDGTTIHLASGNWLASDFVAI